VLAKNLIDPAQPVLAGGAPHARKHDCRGHAANFSRPVCRRVDSTLGFAQWIF
jgi:hypothetical protein